MSQGYQESKFKLNNEWLLIDGKLKPLLDVSLALQKRLTTAHDISSLGGVKGFQPLQLSQVQGVLKSPYAKVRSEKALAFTKSKGVVAQMLCRPFEGLKNLTRYDMGEFVFALLDEHGHVLEHITVPLGSFNTYEYGRASNQILEYVATLCDIDLTPYGFRAFRYHTQLLYQGQPEKPGLNIKLLHQQYPPNKPVQGETTDVGIIPGLSTLDPNQIKGKATVGFYGAFELNGHPVQLLISQRQASDLETIEKLILQEINGLSSLTQVKASFDLDHHLVLTQTQPGPQHAIVIRTLHPALPAEVEDVSLAVPEGKTTGQQTSSQQGPETDFGKLLLNQVPITLGKLSHLQYTSDTAAQEILRQFNQNTIHTGILASVDEQRHLILTPVREDVSIHIAELCDSQNKPLENHPLGLVAGNTVNPIKEWQGVLELLKQFVRVFNQLSTAIRSSVMQAPAGDAQNRLKQLESRFYEGVLSPMDLKGLDIKQPFNEILGVQLVLNEKVLQSQWQAQPMGLQAYFLQVATQMETLATTFQPSPEARPTTAPEATVAVPAPSGLNIQSRPYPGNQQRLPLKATRLPDAFRQDDRIQESQSSASFDHKI